MDERSLLNRVFDDRALVDIRGEHSVEDLLQDADLGLLPRGRLCAHILDDRVQEEGRPAVVRKDLLDGIRLQDIIEISDDNARATLRGRQLTASLSSASEMKSSSPI